MILGRVFIHTVMHDCVSVALRSALCCSLPQALPLSRTVRPRRKFGTSGTPNGRTGGALERQVMPSGLGIALAGFQHAPTHTLLSRHTSREQAAAAVRESHTRLSPVTAGRMQLGAAPGQLLLQEGCTAVGCTAVCFAASGE